MNLKTALTSFCSTLLPPRLRLPLVGVSRKIRQRMEPKGAIKRADQIRMAFGERFMESKAFSDCARLVIADGHGDLVLSHNGHVLHCGRFDVKHTIKLEDGARRATISLGAEGHNSDVTFDVNSELLNWLGVRVSEGD